MSAGRDSRTTVGPRMTSTTNGLWRHCGCLQVLSSMRPLRRSTYHLPGRSVGSVVVTGQLRGDLDASARPGRMYFLDPRWGHGHQVEVTAQVQEDDMEGPQAQENEERSTELSRQVPP